MKFSARKYRFYTSKKGSSSPSVLQTKIVLGPTHSCGNVCVYVCVCGAICEITVIIINNVIKYTVQTGKFVL